MKSKIYNFFRIVFKIPRPNELPGWEKVENKWDFFNVLLYIKFAIGHLSSWIGFAFGLIQTILLLGIVTKQTNLWVLGITIIFGGLVMFIGGHILIVLGTMKREGNLAATQNEPTLKLLENTEKILYKLEKNESIQK